jgi:Arc/MetJ family transcription regulator
MELITQAQRVLGTSQVTDTVNRALKDVVDRDRRRQLLAMGRGDLTPERLDEMRRNRSFESREAVQPT